MARGEDGIVFRVSTGELEVKRMQNECTVIMKIKYRSHCGRSIPNFHYKYIKISE